MIISVLIGAFVTNARADQNPYAAVYDNVLQVDADRAVASCAALQKTLANVPEPERRDAFVKLARAWARVQAGYILGGYDMDAMDYPLLVDYFHVGKENIHESLARIVADDTLVAAALYKNSYKTVGALGDVMFSGAWSPRREILSRAIAANVCRNLARIRDGYREHRTDYLGDSKKALSLLINAMLESIYKTRDWRIAQVSGLNKQTLGQYLPQNQQYPYSKASWAAIGATIDTYAQLIGADRQPNIATIAHAKNADSGLLAVQKALAMTQQAYRDTPPGRAFQL
ncbi:MAG: hypothetical protein P8011_15820 [Acidihalobacter sp.]